MGNDVSGEGEANLPPQTPGQGPSVSPNSGAASRPRSETGPARTAVNVRGNTEGSRTRTRDTVGHVDNAKKVTSGPSSQAGLHGPSTGAQHLDTTSIRQHEVEQSLQDGKTSEQVAPSVAQGGKAVSTMRKPDPLGSDNGFVGPQQDKRHSKTNGDRSAQNVPQGNSRSTLRLGQSNIQTERQKPRTSVTKKNSSAGTGARPRDSSMNDGCRAKETAVHFDGSASSTRAATRSMPSVPKMSAAVCALCKITKMSSDVSGKINYSQCTHCHLDVCNQCGFNPSPHLPQVKDWLCLNCQIQHTPIPSKVPTDTPQTKITPKENEHPTEMAQSVQAAAVAQKSSPQAPTSVPQSTMPSSLKRAPLKKPPAVEAQSTSQGVRREDVKNQVKEPKRENNVMLEGKPQNLQNGPRVVVKDVESGSRQPAKLQIGTSPTNSGQANVIKVTDHKMNHVGKRTDDMQQHGVRSTEVHEMKPQVKVSESKLARLPVEGKCQAIPCAKDTRPTQPGSPAKGSEESVAGKLFGFGASLFNQATNIISVASQPNSQPSSQNSSPRKQPGTSAGAEIPKVSLDKSSPKKQNFQQEDKKKMQEEWHKGRDLPSSQTGTDDKTLARRTSKPRETGSHQGGTEHVKGNGTAVQPMACALCNCKLNVNVSKPNNNTCTYCHVVVCNQCGFNPLPHIPENKEWLCLTCQAKKVQAPQAGDMKPPVSHSKFASFQQARSSPVRQAQQVAPVSNARSTSTHPTKQLPENLSRHEEPKQSRLSHPNVMIGQQPQTASIRSSPGGFLDGSSHLRTSTTYMDSEKGINNAIHQKESLQKNQYNSRLTQIQSSYTVDNTPLEKTSKAFLQTPERKHHSQTRKKITTHSGTEMKMTQNYYNDFAVIFDNMEQSRPVSLSISSDTVHLHEDDSIDDKEVEVSWPESLDSLDEELARIERHDMVEDSSESTPSPLPPKPEGQESRACESGGNTCEDDHMHEHMKKRTVDEDCSLSEKNDFICIRANNLNEDSTKVSSIIVPESKKKEYLFDEGNNSKCEMNMNHDELQHYLEQVHPLEQLDVFVSSTTRNKHGTFDKEPELEMESLTNSAKERPQGKDLFGLSADSYATSEGCSSASLSSVDEDSDGSPSSLETEDSKKQKKAKYHAHGPQLPTIEDSSEDEELREEELLKEQERLLEQEQQLRKALGRKSRREKEEMRGQRRRQRSRASPSNLSPIEDASPTEELRQAAEMEELQRSSCSEYSPSAESEPEVFESYAEKLLKLQQEFHLLTTHPSGGKPVKKNGEYSQRQSRKSSGKKLKSAEEVYEEMMQKAQLLQSSSSKEQSYSAINGINDAPLLKNVKEDMDHDRQSASKNSQKYNGYSQANEQFTVLQNKNDDISFTNRNAVKGTEQEFQASQENHSPHHWLSNSSEESFAMPNVRTEEQTGLSSVGTSSHRPASVEPKFQTYQTKRLSEGTSTNSFDSKEQYISSDAQAIVTSGKGRTSQTQEFSQRMSPQPRSASVVKEAQTTSEKHSHVAETMSRSLQHFGCQTDAQSNGKYMQGSSRLTKAAIVPNDETVTLSNNDQLRTYDPNCGLKLEDERTVVCCDVVYKLPFMRPKVTEQAFPTIQMSEQPSNKENKEVQVDMDVVGFSSLRPSYSDTNLVDSYHRQECQHGNRRNKARYTCDYVIEKRAALCQKPIRRYNSDLSISKTDRECQCFHSPVNDDKYWHSTADTIQEINKLCAELKELQQQWVAYNHQREHEQVSQMQTQVTALLPPNVAQQGSSKSFKGNVQQLPSSSFSEIDTCLLKDKSMLNQPCPFPESRISTSANIICTTTTCVLSSIPITTQPISLLVPGFRQSPKQDCIRFSIPNTSANTFTMSSYPRSQNLPHQPSLGLMRSIGPQSIFSSSLGAVPFSRGAAPLQFGREGTVQGFISPLQQYQGSPFVYGKPALTHCIQSTKPENLPCAIPMQHAFSGITSINGETGLGIPTKTQLLQQQLNIINSMLQRNASFSPWPLMSQNQRPDVSGRDKTINVPIHPLTALSSSLPPSNAANAQNRVDVASYGNLHVRNELVQSNTYENNGSKQDKLSDVKKEADSNAPKDLTKQSEEMAKARARSNSFGTQNDVYKQHQQQIVLEYRRVQEELDRERREMQRQLEQEKQVVQSELQHLWGMKQQIWQQQQEVRQAELAQQLELVAQQRKQLVNMQQLQQQLQQQIEEQNMKKIPLLRESCDYIHSSTGYTHPRTDEKVGLYPHPSCPVHKPDSQIAVDVTQQVTHQPIASPMVELSAKESKGRRAMRRKSFAITARTSTEEDDEASQDDEYVTLPRRRLRANSGVQTDDEEKTQSHGSRRRLAHRKVDCSVQTDDEDNEDKYEYGDGTTTKPKLGYLERSKIPIQYEVRAANIGTPTQIVTDCFVQTKTRETKDFASVKSAPRPPTDTILQTATPPQNVEGYIFPGHRVCEPQLSFGPQSIQSQITPEQYFLALSLQGNAVNYLPRFDGRMNSQAQHQLRASSTMLPTATATTHPAMSLAMEREHLLREIDKELQLVEKASSKLQRQQPHLHTAHKDSHNHTGGVSVQMVNPEQDCTDKGQRLIHFQAFGIGEENICGMTSESPQKHALQNQTHKEDLPDLRDCFSNIPTNRGTFAEEAKDDLCLDSAVTIMQNTNSAEQQALSCGGLRRSVRKKALHLEDKIAHGLRKNIRESQRHIFGDFKNSK